MKINIQKLTTSAMLPQRMSINASGYDIFADVLSPVQIAPGEYVAIPTGFALEIPSGYEAQIRPRSGLAIKRGLSVLNSPGTIDADYRGEVKVILINHGASSIVIQPQMRIAQMVFCPVLMPELCVSDSLAETERHTGGFGHTGL
ncbi:MAG: dUTP diphosphatase [Candidatus Cloacimonetes bacterium]|nr:dUTP diphosphatase [Candidatus Cloacimonadota bacterium]